MHGINGAISGINFNTDYLNPDGDIADLAFLIAAYQLQNYDCELRNEISQLRGLIEVKKAYRQRLDYLNGLIKNTKGDDVFVDADMIDKIDYRWSSEDGSVVEVRSGESLPVKKNKFYLYDENGQPAYVEVSLGNPLEVPHSDQRSSQSTLHIKIPVSGTREEMMEEVEAHPGYQVKCYVKKDVIQAEIERLQGKLDGLNADGEIRLLGINRLMSKRNQAVQLASNIMSSSHQTAMGIIQNIK